MSVKKRPDTGRWEVRWREGNKNRSRSFRAKSDADAFSNEVERRKRLGSLAQLTAGDQTLSELVEEWWRIQAVPNLARNTRQTYALVWDRHARPRLGGLKLNQLTPRVIAGFRSDLSESGVGDPTILKTMTMLQSVMRTAVEWNLISTNPVASVAKPSQKATRSVQPLPPERIEAMRAWMVDRRRWRDSCLVSVLAYGGLRPGEALALRWCDVQDRTILVERAIAFGSEKQTKTGNARSVRLTDTLARDLSEYRLRLGRPEVESLVFPRADGSPWLDHDWRNWRKRSFSPAARSAGLVKIRPYDLRHSFVSLLIHEGLSIVEVAAQAGHSPQTCLSRYAHVFAEFDPGQKLTAEEAIKAARSGIDVRAMYAEGRHA